MNTEQLKKAIEDDFFAKKSSELLEAQKEYAKDNNQFIKSISEQIADIPKLTDEDIANTVVEQVAPIIESAKTSNEANTQKIVEAISANVELAKEDSAGNLAEVKKAITDNIETLKTELTSVQKQVVTVENQTNDAVGIIKPRAMGKPRLDLKSSDFVDFSTLFDNMLKSLNSISTGVNNFACCADTPPEPPVLQNLPILNCDLTTSTVQAEDKPYQKVILGGQERPLILCTSKEYDTNILCTPAGVKVVLVTTYAPVTGIPSTIVYNLDGTVNATPPADLTTCDVDTESDQVVGCDNGVPAVQWIVKKDGVATGTVYYTNQAGAVYTPTAFTVGVCSVITPLNTHKTFADRYIGAGSYDTASKVSNLRSISITRVSGTGAVDIQTNAGDIFSLDFNREVFTDSAFDHENQSSDWVLGDYKITITGNVVVKWHGLL